MRKKPKRVLRFFLFIVQCRIVKFCLMLACCLGAMPMLKTFQRPEDLEASKKAN